MRRRLHCACGCGDLLVGKRRNALYADATHRKRAQRAAESVTSVDPSPNPQEAQVTASAPATPPPMTAEEMRTRLEALPRSLTAPAARRR
jgi:hypothetical protein